MPLKADDSAAHVEPIPGAEFMGVLAKHSVKLSAYQAETLKEFLEETKPKNATALQGKLSGKTSVAVVEILPHIVNKEGCLPVLDALRDHPDAFLRFVSNCGLAGSGDSDAAKAVFTMLHDASLDKSDQRLVRTWALGAGIDPIKDEATSIQKHLMNLTGKAQKLKPGDACPDFAAITDAGDKLDNMKLEGKVVVFHFWSSSCAPCLSQMPQHIATLSELPRDKAVVVFVSLDESKEQFKASVEKYGMPFQNVCDGAGWGGPLARALGVNQLPFDLVVDSHGKIFSHSIRELPSMAK